MRFLVRILGIGVLCAAVFQGWLWHVDRNLPQYQGRSVRSWFWELCRVGSLPQQGLRGAKRELECRMAILRMGTNALPYLAEQALGPRREGMAATEIHRWSSRLPQWVGGSLWPPAAHVRGEAAWFFRPLRPSGAMVLELLEAVGHSGSGTEQRQVETVLLGCAGEGVDRVLPELVERLLRGEDPWLRATAARSIRWLGLRASGALDAVLVALDQAPQDPELLDWLAFFGPPGEKAVPALEGLIAAPDDTVRFHAAVALLQMRPSHSGALEVLRPAAELDLRMTPVTRLQREQFLAALTSGAVRTNDAVAGIVEPLARVEVLAWTQETGPQFAARALERLAPVRAAILYRAALKGPGAVHAAAGLLRLNRLDEEATAFLTDIIRSGDERAEKAVLALSEASSTNTSALRSLTEVAGRGLRPRRVDRIPDRRLRIQALAAEYALVRIRFRELLEGMGLDEWGG